MNHTVKKTCDLKHAAMIQITLYHDSSQIIKTKDFNKFAWISKTCMFKNLFSMILKLLRIIERDSCTSYLV